MATAVSSAVLRLCTEQVADFARGCAALGSGGGGDVRAGAALLHNCLDRRGGVTASPISGLPRDAVVALAGAVGSPTVMAERMPSGEEFARAIERLESASGRRIDAIAPLEIGGINGLLGVVAACHSGRALVDADGMGRAFPRLDQCVLDAPATPLALADPSGGVLLLEGVRPEAVEATVRGVLPALGTWAAIALHLTTAGEFAEQAVLGSIGRALRLGRHLGACAAGAELDPAAEARELVVGTVLEVHRDDLDRTHGVVTIGDDRDRSSTVRLDHAEEFVCALRDGEPMAYAPDVLTLVDGRRWDPLGVADVRVGQRVRLLQIPAPPRLRSRTLRHDLASYSLADLPRIES